MQRSKNESHNCEVNTMDRPTEKQLAYIADLQEFSDYPLPKFEGKTKREASDYIDRWIKLAHERADKWGFY